MNRVRPLAALFCCGLLPTLAWSDPHLTGWQELAAFNPKPARTHFARLEGREARYGELLALLNSQPRTARQFATVRAGLEALRAESPGDDIGIAAAYHLARLHQLHTDKPDPDAALAGYRALLAAHAGHPAADLAAPKLALLLLYREASPEAWERHLAEVLTLLPNLRSPEARRDTRLVAADALVRLQGDFDRAHPLIVYCLEHNLVVRPPRLAVLLLQAAEGARRSGNTDEAQHYYDRYLAEFPRKTTTAEIQRRRLALAEEARP